MARDDPSASGDDDSDVRASVLEVALQLGMQDGAVADWVFEGHSGEDTPLDPRYSQRGTSSASSSSAASKADPISNRLLDPTAPASERAAMSESSYYSPQGGLDSPSDDSARATTPSLPRPSPDLSAYDMQSSIRSFQPRPPMPYERSPYNFVQGPGPKIFQTASTPRNYSPSSPYGNFAHSIYVSHNPSTDTLDSDPFRSSITRAALSTTTLASTTSTVKSSSKLHKLKKTKPGKSRDKDGYASDASAISTKSTTKKRKEKKKDPSPPVPELLRPASSQTDNSRARSRTTSDAQQPQMLGFFSRTPTSRPSTATSAQDSNAELPTPDTPKKSKSFRFGFKRSKSNPELPTAKTPVQPPSLDIPPLPPLSLLAELSPATPPMTRSNSGATTTATLRSPITTKASQSSLSAHSHESKLTADTSKLKFRQRSEFDASTPSTPTLNDREERMKAWTMNRATTAAGGPNAGLFFGSHPSGENSIRTGRAAIEDVDETSSTSSRSQSRAASRMRANGASEMTRPRDPEPYLAEPSPPLIRSRSVPEHVNELGQNIERARSVQARSTTASGSTTRYGLPPSPAAPKFNALPQEKQNGQRNENYSHVIASFGPTKPSKPPASKAPTTETPSQLVRARSRSTTGRYNPSKTDSWQTPGSADFTVPTMLTAAMGLHPPRPATASGTSHVAVDVGSKKAVPPSAFPPAASTWQLSAAKQRPAIVRRPSESSAPSISSSSRFDSRPRSFAGSTKSSSSTRSDDLYEALRNPLLPPPAVRDAAIPPPSPPPSSPLPPRPAQLDAYPQVRGDRDDASFMDMDTFPEETATRTPPHPSNSSTPRFPDKGLLLHEHPNRVDGGDRFRDLAMALTLDKHQTQPRVSHESNNSDLSEIDVPDYYYDTDDQPEIEQADNVSERAIDPRFSRDSGLEGHSFEDERWSVTMNAPLLRTGQIAGASGIHSSQHGPKTAGHNADDKQSPVVPSSNVDNLDYRFTRHAVSTVADQGSQRPSHRRHIDKDSFQSLVKKKEEDDEVMIYEEYSSQSNSSHNLSNSNNTPAMSTTHGPSQSLLRDRIARTHGAREPAQPPRSTLASRDGPNFLQEARSRLRKPGTPPQVHKGYWV